jgi:hypothetical protein
MLSLAVAPHCDSAVIDAENSPKILGPQYLLFRPSLDILWPARQAAQVLMADGAAWHQLAANSTCEALAQTAKQTEVAPVV